MLEYTIRTKPFRRGDKFSATCLLENGSDPVAIPEGANIIANLRTENSALVAHLAVSVHDQVKEAGAFSIAVDDTSSFPVGTNIYLTVVFVIGSDILASATLSIPVIS